MLLEAPSGSSQLSLLRNALLWRDNRLQEAVARPERGTVAGESTRTVSFEGIIDVRDCSRLEVAWHWVCVLLAMLIAKMHYLIKSECEKFTHWPARSMELHGALRLFAFHGI